MPSANASLHPAMAGMHAPARERVRRPGEPMAKGHRELWAPQHADRRSLVHDAEANLRGLDEAFAGEVEQVFRQDVAQARRPCWQRRTEALARRLAFFL